MQLKLHLKYPTKITPMYGKSPFYMGTQLWNELSEMYRELRLSLNLKGPLINCTVNKDFVVEN